MAKRKRKPLTAPTSNYTSVELGQTLTVRGALSPKTRAQYAQETSPAGVRAAMTQEDVRERAIEFLFERLVCGWEIAGVPTEKPKELLTRYRVASREERAWITSVLREHCAEWFPDVAVP